MTPNVIPGERPLVAFVSSVMKPALQWARDAAVEALTINPTLVPWAFEYTPASSEDAATTYLDKVCEADIFVWLVGDETTDPVRGEVEKALKCEKRIWAFTLPADSRDSVTAELLDAVRKRVKTADAQDADELRAQLALTFSDEVIRAIRETPGLGRLAHLEAVGRRSRARMVSRWVGVGLDEAEAIGFADDLRVGAPPASALPDDEHRLRVVVADVGAGKSVVAERWLQEAIIHARDSASAPIPVFLRMRETEEGLETAIRSRTDEFGDVRAQGAFVVVDGADEAEPRIAARTIEEARELIATWPQTQILVTSRPTPALQRGVPERVELPLLDPEEARSLVGRVSEGEVTPGAESGWPTAVRDAVRRPLFAILLGLNRRAHRGDPQTMGELLDTLVEFAIEPSELADVEPVLRRLALLVTDRGAPVERGELGEVGAGTAARASRLVREENGLIDFALPLLAQWFAAEALIHGDVAVAELAADAPRLDRWRYALAIALARGPRAFIDEAMTVLVAADPGFSAQLVEDSFRRWGTSDDGDGTAPLASAIEAGTGLRDAFETWGSAIEPVDDLLLTRRADGDLAPLGVAVGGSGLTFGWYGGGEVLDPVVELPRDASPFHPTADWFIRRWGVWANERGWAWRWALEDLKSNLEQLINQRLLRYEDPALIDEALWLVALAAAGKGSLYHDPIPTAVVEAAVVHFDPAVPIKLGDRYAPTDLVLTRLGERAAQGSDIESPWPGPDQELRGGFIWDPYSAEQQRRRTEAVYTAAVHAYESITARWFPHLKPRMRTAVTLPATLRGRLSPSTPPPSGWESAPTLSWWLDPLPAGEESRVEIVLADAPEGDEPRGSEDWRERFRVRHQRLVELRPEAAGWISAVEHHSLTDVFQGAPLAPLVFDWIKGDLKAIKWQ